MASIFGDDGIDDLFNNQLPPEENQELPSGDEGENLFGDDQAADGEAGADGEGDGKPVKVEPKKRSVRNPRPRLTVDTLRGQRGIQTIEQYFTDIKYRGKGYERQDLDEVMRRLQHWGHRMYPTYKFDDVLSNIERLGKKKTLQVHMSRYRLGMLQEVPTAGADELGDDDDGGANAADEPFDEFDALLGEQIAISKLAPRTPAQTPQNRYSGGGGGIGGGGYANTSAMSSSTFVTPSFSRGHAAMSTPYSTVGAANLNESDLATPLPASQPESPAPSKAKLTSEQMARIAENRRKALEIRAKRLQEKQQSDKKEAQV